VTGSPLRPALDHVPADVRALIGDMPKAELHLHLDGSLRVETALELARTRDVDAPRTLEGMRAALVAPERCGSQAELLRAFDLPIALLQDADSLARASADLVAAKAAEGVSYLEIRWGPLLHVRGGLALADGIEAVVEAGRAAAGRTSTTVRFICTALRSHDPVDNVRLAESAARFLDRGLTGWDLAGPEEAHPDPLVHAAAFEAARAGGLQVTIHAGEWGGAGQVRRALVVEPARIAHGPGAVSDPDLIDELVRRDVCLDLCPTSNVQAGIVASVAAHPLAVLHRAGLTVTLSTDDRTVSDISLSEEYARAVAEIGLTTAELWAIDRRALDVAFADDAALDPIRAAFDAFAAGRPELFGAGGALRR
jgi:adenosine deaminase